MLLFFMLYLGICYFIGGWGWLDFCCGLSGANIGNFIWVIKRKENSSIKRLRDGKMFVILQRFKQPPELNSGFSPKAQESERQSPLFSFHSNPLIAFL